MGYSPNKAILPGQILSRLLVAAGITQKDLHLKTGISEKHISQIIHGEAPITTDTALKLEGVLECTAEFLLNIETNYQITKARIAKESEMLSEVHIADEYPYKELIFHGFIPRPSNAAQLVGNLRKFFGVSSLTLAPKPCGTAYRKNEDGTSDGSLAAWLQCGINQCNRLDLPEYNESKLKSCIPELLSLTEMGEKFAERMREVLFEAGVALVFTPHFKKTRANGATKWVNGHPMVQLSLRGKKADIFWFTFFHEIGHVILHSKKLSFIELDERPNNALEEEADSFARETLIPGEKFEEFLKTQDLSNTSIVKFASQIGIDPGIIVGRLHYEKRLPWNQGNGLVKTLQFSGS